MPGLTTILNGTMIDNNQLNAHREMLLRFALLQLHNESAAEDAVQETLLAALLAKESFRNESAIRTWLIGILKHKIADYYRTIDKHSSFEEINNCDDEDTNAAIEKLLFNNKGHWIGTLNQWSEPDHALQQKEFWIIFEWCQNNLPELHARAFLLREMVGLETTEICNEMDITPSACRVYLHRARLGLRECLEQRWFNSWKAL